MKETRKAKSLTQEWDSLTEILQYVSQPQPKWLEGRVRGSQVVAGQDPFGENKSWYGTTTFQEALLLLENGWKDKLPVVSGFVKTFLDKVTNKVEISTFTYDIEGTGIDVARFVNGEPECWQKLETEQIDGTGTKLVTLAIDIGSNSGVSGEQKIQRGIAVCALVNALELSGHKTRLIATYSGENEGNYLYNIVPVKEFSDDLDMAKCLFVFANPAMQRRIMFNVKERMNDKDRVTHDITEHGGYGRSCNVFDNTEWDINFNHSDFSKKVFRDDKEIEEWVFEQLEKQGVKIKSEVNV